MATNMNRLMALALMPQREPSVKFDPSRTEATTDAEQELAKIIGEETEREREARRGENGKVPQGLLGDVDRVDTLHWDEFLQSPGVLSRCMQRSGLSGADVLKFAVDKCSPSNWDALFWMQAFIEQIARTGRDDATKVPQDDLEKLYAAKQAEEARRRAKAAADARHGQPGGSRDKRAAIRTAWATGKFSDRGVCAEQESDALGMSLFTARRALQGTPNPDPWPGKKAPKPKGRRA